MPDLTVYRLTFPGGLHVGARGVNLEESSISVPSDTLFAALLDAHCRNAGDVNAWFTPASGNADSRQCPYTLSSAFPFVGNVNFFPMPVPTQRFLSPETLKNRRKDVARIRFVSEALFRRMLGGESLDDWLFQGDLQAEPQKGVALQGGALWLTLDECNRLPQGARLPAGKRHALRRYPVYADVRVPRVTVDRMASASTIFHAGRVSFAAECGLWFGISGEVPPGLEAALKSLSEDGLGAERTAGYGAFTYTTAPMLKLPGPQPNGAALLLNRYHPRAEELPQALSNQGSSYALMAVSGWLRSWDGAAQRRRQLWFVREGSLVHLSGNGPWGDVVDVRPTYENPSGDLPHPVWRAGLALGAGLQEV